MIDIAIIEDDQTIRSGYAYLLGNEPGFDICGAYSSIEEALPVIGDKKPDVILLDVHLPGKNGIESIPALRKILPAANIIILTVYESEDKIFGALKNGASGYLTKNTPSERIIESIKEVVNGGGVMSSGIAKLVIKSFQKSTNSPLTKRETEVLEQIAEGKSRSKIAAAFFVDVETIKSHIKNIYLKLDVNSKEDAIEVAKRKKLI